MKDSEPVKNRGISFIDALTLAFIVLKLCGVISWGWLFVLSPMLIKLAVLILASFVKEVSDK